MLPTARPRKLLPEDQDSQRSWQPTGDTHRGHRDRRRSVRYPTERQTSSAIVIHVFRIGREIARPLEDATKFIPRLVQRALARRRQLALGLPRRLWLVENQPQTVRDKILELAPLQRRLRFGPAEE